MRRKRGRVRGEREGGRRRRGRREGQKGEVTVKWNP